MQCSLISRPRENSCDSILRIPDEDDGLVASFEQQQQQQQQLEMLAADAEEIAERDATSSCFKSEAAAMVEARQRCVTRSSNEDDTDIYITGFHGQPQPAFETRLLVDECVPIEATRLERSNSCSQADTVHSIEQQQLAAVDAAAVAKCMLGPTSISHEDLTCSASGAAAAAATAAATIVYDHEPSSSFIPPVLDTPDYLCTQQRLSEADPDGCHSRQQLNPTTLIEAPKDEAALSLTTQQQNLLNSSSQQTNNTGSSRFFPSKLNTGSLWSLLSVGSNHSASSASNANETMTTTTENQAHGSSIGGGQNKQQLENDASKQQDKNFKSSLSLSFFNRVQQFKRQHSNQESVSASRPPTTSSSSIDEGSLCNKGDSLGLNQQHPDRSSSSMKRFRFQVKYIGSALLHKNFTLPMLEWIARDIKRQTVRGALSTNQRQFTIPARDIILEIQSYQLMGASCKDGHCIFVHPMHCVSKYAQLQHDPNCFSYLIRDSKESPYFCHVFQAKSTSKVHEIFSAIREATTLQTSARQQPPQHLPPDKNVPSSISGTAEKQSNPGIQKSASSDGQSRNIFGHSMSKDPRVLGVGSPPRMLGTPQLSLMSNSNPIFSPPTVTRTKQESEDENAQFENNYQFEVMFVKKVKLQCRRVPASFVDDALETLKSFDVLKGTDSKAQIKGIGKRIISASVDERQEYDEVCHPPTPTIDNQYLNNKSTTVDNIVADAADSEQRRGSSASLNRNHSPIKEERESRSCQQSPAKVSAGPIESNQASNSDMSINGASMKKHHQSMSCLDNLESTIKTAKAGDTPHYFNDFSPYNTITSNDLNERIAAIPVVSGSVSLDHETRQRLARQVRETIMATAANIKKDVYAGGDMLDTSSSFKVLDSLSCTVVSEPPIDTTQSVYDQRITSSQIPTSRTPSGAQAAIADHRRSSATTGQFFQPNSKTTNNFDLFRRASARQVVKNRTMLLLIGKDELCTISIDKHQVLFSKSFSSIVHCLQGSNNRDHFGLICRDSGKINPNTESYAGLIFKCQSDKVVREIMGALKQVIYNSQHNYHGYNSIYNPLNASQNTTKSQNSPKLERPHTTTSPSPSFGSSAQNNVTNSIKNLDIISADQAATRSLAAKRGFQNHLDLDSSKILTGNHHLHTQDRSSIGTAPPSTSSVLSKSGALIAAVKPPKNLIKSMFCDNCPLYWYHRLCCDVESLPAESCKAIILRRVDSSLAEREQDELYSKFSDFNIESIDEHNEIFMSLLRHICERNQLRHNQTHAHQVAIAKNNPNLVKQSTLPSLISRQSSSQTPTSGGLTSAIMSNSSSLASAFSRGPSAITTSAASSGHQRSGSSGGSLGFVLGPSSNQSISDAGTMAMDNLKRAKNNLSVSIENMLKRRSSIRDDMDDGQQQQQQPQTLNVVDSKGSSSSSYLPSRSGSFRSATRDSRSTAIQDHLDQDGGSLKRSSSTSDYSSTKQLNQSMNSLASWRDSFSRTINDDLTNLPLMGLFRRRSSTFGTKGSDGEEDNSISRNQKNGASTDGLNRIETQHYVTPQHQPASPSSFESRFNLNPVQTNSGSSPSSMLSSTFWKKSIFDKIRQPHANENPIDGEAAVAGVKESREQAVEMDSKSSSYPQMAQLDQVARLPSRRTKEELRSLWKKAIFEQITLIKMDKQNQRLQAAISNEHDIQRIKLNYKDVPYKRDAYSTWNRLLKQDPTKKVEYVEVARLVRYGVPKQRRGEIWMFLMNQYQLRHGTSFQPIDSDYHGDANQTYRSLLSLLSTQQHEIFVDIGKYCY